MLECWKLEPYTVLNVTRLPPFFVGSNLSLKKEQDSNNGAGRPGHLTSAKAVGTGASRGWVEGGEHRERDLNFYPALNQLGELAKGNLVSVSVWMETNLSPTCLELLRAGKPWNSGWRHLVGTPWRLVTTVQSPGLSSGTELFPLQHSWIFMNPCLFTQICPCILFPLSSLHVTLCDFWAHPLTFQSLISVWQSVMGAWGEALLVWVPALFSYSVTGCKTWGKRLIALGVHFLSVKWSSVCSIAGCGD